MTGTSAAAAPPAASAKRLRMMEASWQHWFTFSHLVRPPLGEGGRPTPAAPRELASPAMRAAPVDPPPPPGARYRHHHPHLTTPAPLPATDHLRLPRLPERPAQPRHPHVEGAGRAARPAARGGRSLLRPGPAAAAAHAALQAGLYRLAHAHLLPEEVGAGAWVGPAKVGAWGPAGAGLTLGCGLHRWARAGGWAGQASRPASEWPHSTPQPTPLPDLHSVPIDWGVRAARPRCCAGCLSAACITTTIMMRVVARVRS